MKIILIILAILITTSSKSFSLTYKKLENVRGIAWTDGSQGGKAVDEGFFGAINNFPNCIKLKKYATEADLAWINSNIYLRQGLRVYYKPDGSIFSSDNGLYDCKLTAGKITFSLDEGISEQPEGALVFFKKENSSNHYYNYIKKDNAWSYVIRNMDAGKASELNANLKVRPATKEEIQHGEKLLQFYRNLDLSSPTAKKYLSINNINDQLNQTQNKQTNKTEDKTIIKKQSNMNIVTELEKLDKLLKGGSITKEEHQKAKNKLLN